jgi:hypothetical protein
LLQKKCRETCEAFVYLKLVNRPDGCNFQFGVEGRCLKNVWENKLNTVRMKQWKYGATDRETIEEFCGISVYWAVTKEL